MIHIYMNTKREINSEIGKHAYGAPRTERVQVATEGRFAASQGVTDNSPSGVAVDSWTKVGGTDSDTWSDR